MGAASTQMGLGALTLTMALDDPSSALRYLMLRRMHCTESFWYLGHTASGAKRVWKRAVGSGSTLRSSRHGTDSIIGIGTLLAGRFDVSSTLLHNFHTTVLIHSSTETNSLSPTVPLIEPFTNPE